jgi:hypothetical protein
MSEKAQALSVTELLSKNQAAAGIFKQNRKKLDQIQRRSGEPKRKEYGLGLPYQRLLIWGFEAPAPAPASEGPKGQKKRRVSK